MTITLFVLFIVRQSAGLSYINYPFYAYKTENANVKLPDLSTESGVKASPHGRVQDRREDSKSTRLVLHLLGICCVPVDGLQDERPAHVHFEGNKQNSKIISPHRVPHC